MVSETTQHLGAIGVAPLEPLVGVSFRRTNSIESLEFLDCPPVWILFAYFDPGRLI